MKPVILTLNHRYDGIDWGGRSLFPPGAVVMAATDRGSIMYDVVAHNVERGELLVVEAGRKSGKRRRRMLAAIDEPIEWSREYAARREAFHRACFGDEPSQSPVLLPPEVVR